MSSSVAFLTLGDGTTSHDVQVLLKKAHVPPPFKQAVQLCAPGSRLRLHGVMKTHERGWPVLVCERMTLLRCSPQPLGRLVCY